MLDSVQDVDVFPVPVVDPDRCTGCGLCVRVCPSQALEMKEAAAAITHPEACNYTGHCERICPVQAITRPFQIVFVRAKGLE